MILPASTIARILAACALLAAPSAGAADYHVSPQGDDAHDGLRPQSAFRTLAAACRATPAGKHTIHLAAGDYHETASAVPAPGVSIAGAGIGKTILHWSARQPARETKASPEADKTAIRMIGSADASISGFTLVGNLPDGQRANTGIVVHGARKVSIHDCEVKGMEFCGIWLHDAEQSSIRNNRIEDCGHPHKDSCSGGLQIGHLTDSVIHHNTIREHRGAYGIKTCIPDWTERNDPWCAPKVRLTRVHLHHNDIKLRQQGGWGQGQPNMAIELWHSEPDHCEIHRNRINTCVSLVEGGRAAKTIRVHHNLFLLDPGYSYAIEAGHHNMEIDHNVFRNGFYPIACFGPSIDHLKIHHNTFDGVENHGVCNMPGVSNFSFCFNTVVVKADMHVLNIGSGDKPGQANRVAIRNNLFVKDGTPASVTTVMKLHGSSSSDAVSIRDNAFWNWSPDGESPLVADPQLERSAEGDHLLRLSARSPMRAARRGNVP